MADFATVTDLEGWWRPLSDSEKTRAGKLLAGASARIRVEAPWIDARIVGDPPALDPIIVEQIVCDMVKRAMQSAIDQPAMTNYQTMAGPFSQSGTFANPSGDLYLTKNEKRLLGINKQRAFMIDTMPPREE